MSEHAIAKRALDQGQGVVRLTPTWVPRSFCIPGKRIKLHPEDYYALGANRGGIDERWFSSTTPADNGPLTSKNEGLSHLVVEDGSHTGTCLLRDAVEELKGQLIGDDLWNAQKLFGNHLVMRDRFVHREHIRGPLWLVGAQAPGRVEYARRNVPTSARRQLLVEGYS